MSLLRRLNQPPSPNRQRVLRGLFEALLADPTLHDKLDATFVALLAEDADAEIDKERQRWRENRLDYLFGPPPPPPSPRPPKASPALPPDASFTDIKRHLQHRLLSEVDPSFDATNPQIRTTLRDLFDAILAESELALTAAETNDLFDTLVADVLGFGPLEKLLADESIDSIVVLGQQVFATRQGRREPVPVAFDNQDHVLRIVDRMVTPAGKKLDSSESVAFGRLRDGTRVVAISTPTTQNRVLLALHKTPRTWLDGPALVEAGTLSAPALAFLQACVLAGVNLLVTGAERSGKTTLLKVLSQAIPATEFIAQIGPWLEFVLPQPMVARLQTPVPTLATTVTQLLATALTMRPDRLVLESLQDIAILPLFQHHVPWLAALTAMQPEHAAAALETLCLLTPASRPLPAVHGYLLQAALLLVQLERTSATTVRVTQLAQLEQDSAGKLQTGPLLVWQNGDLRPTGHVLQPALRARLFDTRLAEPLRAQAMTLLGVG